MMVSQEMARRPAYDEMESLFVNNDKLQRIESYLNRFNPIRVMKMERMEIRHSAILAWLLDPRETHGLGDRFLKAFLGEALRGCSDLGQPTALDISRSDMRDAEVRCEWQNIDIFVLCPQNRWAFVIENKFDSKQHSNQLSRYIDRVKAVYEPQASELIVRGVFLTLIDEEPEDARYAPIRYDTICEFLPQLMGQTTHGFPTEVATFLTHYLDILKDATGMSKESEDMEELARQLYRDHKKVLDFVIEHGASSDFALAAHTLFGTDPGYLEKVEIGGKAYRFCGLGNDQVSFLPEGWYQGFGADRFEWSGSKGWWAGYPMIAWFSIWSSNDGAKGQMRVFAEVGPLSDHQFRKELIESIQEVAIEIGSKRVRFQRGATDEGKKYSKFLKDNTISIRDMQDADEISEAIKTLLARFQPEFDAISKTLPQFARFGVSAQ